MSFQGLTDLQGHKLRLLLRLLLLHMAQTKSEREGEREHGRQSIGSRTRTPSARRGRRRRRRNPCQSLSRKKVQYNHCGQGRVKAKVVIYSWKFIYSLFFSPTHFLQAAHLLCSILKNYSSAAVLMIRRWFAFFLSFFLAPVVLLLSWLHAGSGSGQRHTNTHTHCV